MPIYSVVPSEAQLKKEAACGTSRIYVMLRRVNKEGRHASGHIDYLFPRAEPSARFIRELQNT